MYKYTVPPGMGSNPPRDSGSFGSRSSAGCMAWVAAIVAFIVIYGALAASVPTSVAIRAAQGISLTHIRVVSSSIWAAELFCGDDDIKVYKVTGDNAQGDRVTIRVCVTPWRTSHIIH